MAPKKSAEVEKNGENEKKKKGARHKAKPQYLVKDVDEAADAASWLMEAMAGTPRGSPANVRVPANSRGPTNADSSVPASSISGSEEPLDVRTEGELRAAIEANTPWIRLAAPIALERALPERADIVEPLGIKDKELDVRISAMPNCSLDGTRCSDLGVTIMVRTSQKMRLESLTVKGFGVRVLRRGSVTATDVVLEGDLSHWSADGGGQIAISGGSIVTGEESYAAIYAGGEGTRICLDGVRVGGGGSFGILAQNGGQIELRGTGESCVAADSTFEHAFYEAEPDREGHRGQISGLTDRSLITVGPPQ